VDTVDSPVKLELARLAANFCRRKIPKEEMQEWITFLVGKGGLKPEEIAKKTGISLSTIYRHLPQEFKGEVSKKISEGIKEKYDIARQEVAVATPTVTIQETAEFLPKPQPSEQPVECDDCHVYTWFSTKLRDGHVICTLCLNRLLQQKQITKDDLLKEGEAPTVKPKAEIKPEAKVFKPKETWEQRKAVMSPQHSKMEEIILAKLYEKDVKPVIVDREFCVLSTTPDFYFPNRNLAVYLDGSVHDGKQDRDEQLRESLTKRHGLKVISIPYDGSSQQEVDRVLEQIIKEA
jgi:very-short-patch-repair endonuclease